jgi:hypothetical protein
VRGENTGVQKTLRIALPLILQAFECQRLSAIQNPSLTSSSLNFSRMEAFVHQSPELLSQAKVQIDKKGFLFLTPPPQP